MTAEAPVLISGAGPVGTLLAILLARRGRRVELYERRADPRSTPPERGRSINLALAARGLQPLARAGVLQRIEPQLVAMPGRMLHDEHGDMRFIAYGQRPGELIHSINRADLSRALVAAAAEQPGIDLHFEQRCIDADPQAAELLVRAADGSERRVRGSMLIGADGAGSALRTALQRRGLLQASESALAHDYKEFAIAPLADGGFALPPHALHIWPRGNFMLIALPNADGSFTATLFLPRSAADSGTDSFAALGDAHRARDWFAGHFPDALALLPDFAAQFSDHPQGQLATLRCWPWHAGRALLVGDAAHAIVPFHGQGLNCGFEDCALLDAQLAGGADPQRAFADYERGRRLDTDAIAAMALENYQEMRDTVRSSEFSRRRQLALALERQYPERFIPRYSMVMFHAEIPYAEALRRGAVQEEVLTQLLAGATPPPVEAPAVAELLQRAGL